MKAAIDAYSRAMDIAPKEAKIAMALSRLLQKKGDLDAARAVLEQGVDKCSDKVGVLRMLMDVEMHNGDLKNMLATIKKVSNIDGQDAEVWKITGLINEELRDMNTAIDAFVKVTKINSDSIDAWAHLGGLLNDVGRVKEAISACREAIVRDTSNVDAWYNFGKALSSQNDKYEAMAAFHKVTSLDPSNSGAWYNLGVLMKDTKDIPGSIEAFKIAKALEDGTPLSEDIERKYSRKQGIIF